MSEKIEDWPLTDTQKLELNEGFREWLWNGTGDLAERLNYGPDGYWAGYY